MNTHLAGVVVAFDGGCASTSAVLWAAGEAARRNCPLTVVRVVVPGTAGTELDLRDDLDVDDGGEDMVQVQRILEHAADMVADRVPSISTLLAEGVDDPSLTLCLHDAAVLVLGRRGRTGQRAASLGSTSAELVRRTTCPIVVVPESAQPSRARVPLVVVGLDRRHEAAGALAFAIAEASLRGATLEVLYAVHDKGAASRPVGAARARWEELLELLVPLTPEWPEVTVSPVITAKPLLDALVERSAAAELVVVGSADAMRLGGLQAGAIEADLMRSSAAAVAYVRAAPAVDRHPVGYKAPLLSAR